MSSLNYMLIVIFKSEFSIEIICSRNSYIHPFSGYGNGYKKILAHFEASFCWYRNIFSLSFFSSWGWWCIGWWLRSIGWVDTECPRVSISRSLPNFRSSHCTQIFSGCIVHRSCYLAFGFGHHFEKSLLNYTGTEHNFTYHTYEK